MDFPSGWNYSKTILMIKNKNCIILIKNLFKIIKPLIGITVIGVVVEAVVV